MRIGDMGSTAAVGLQAEKSTSCALSGAVLNVSTGLKAGKLVCCV